MSTLHTYLVWRTPKEYKFRLGSQTISIPITAKRTAELTRLLGQWAEEADSGHIS